MATTQVDFEIVWETNDADLQALGSGRVGLKSIEASDDPVAEKT